MWIYRQASGELTRTMSLDDDHVGYSGHGAGRNNPGAEQTPFVGPIPRGYWTIGPPRDVTVPGAHGPFVLPLLPHADTNTFGRAGFLIHGDSIEHPGEASEGCVVFSRDVRDRIAESGDTLLLVR
jgi:hypothetical protein